MSKLSIDTVFSNNQESGVLKEIANLTGNAAATALSAMLGQTFQAALPDVCVYESADQAITEIYGANAVVASVNMTTQVTTEMLFAMSSDDALALSNVMMGMPADSPADGGISDIQLSAFGEAVSQMMGASGNGLSAFLAKRIDFTTPQTGIFGKDSLESLSDRIASGKVITLMYELSGDGPIANLKLVQFFNDNQVQEFVSTTMSASTPEPSSSQSSSTAEQNTKVTVQPVQFAPLTPMPEGFDINNMGLVRDIQLNLSVELGRSEITIKDVLELARGSVIELDRIAGEPVDLLANGKLIAKGEVVVIEDNFGFRVTQIVSPAERMAAV